MGLPLSFLLALGIEVEDVASTDIIAGAEGASLFVIAGKSII